MEKHINANGQIDPSYTKYSCGLQTPIWTVAESAKKYCCSKRIETLSKPKSYDDIYIPDRTVCNSITPGMAFGNTLSDIFGCIYLFSSTENNLLIFRNLNFVISFCGAR